MALASLLQKSNVLLSRRARLSFPIMTLKTSAPVHGLFGWDKPEFDEKGELGFPESDEIATGMAKKEIEVRNAGNDDPFTIGAIYRGNQGTKLDPIRVPSAFESRTIGCKCHPEQHTIFHMWLHQGEPKRCRCGFWMVLYYKEPFCDWSIPQ